jgi:hypothetical protein
MPPISNPDDTAIGGVRLTGRLPKEDARNGLAAVASDLIEDPDRYRIAVVVFAVDRNITRRSDHTTSSIVELLRIEPLEGKAETAGRKLLAEAAGRRTGDQLSLDSFDEWAAGTDDEDHE